MSKVAALYRYIRGDFSKGGGKEPAAYSCRCYYVAAISLSAQNVVPGAADKPGLWRWVGLPEKVCLK